MLILYQVTRPAVQPNLMLCIYKLMVAFILHKPWVITWRRERRLKWGSVDAAAQVGQSVIFSTKTSSTSCWANTLPLPPTYSGKRGKKKPPLENTTLDWSTNPQSQACKLVLKTSGWMWHVTHSTHLWKEEFISIHTMQCYLKTNPSAALAWETLLLCMG